jgi:hypothetical protein
MVMNKRGQTILVALMLGIVCFWLGLTLAYPFSQVVQDARAEGQLNCSTVTEYQDKANCVVVDIMLPLFVGTIFGIAGFFIGGRFL